MATYKYHVTAKWKEKERTHSHVTQLYSIGVYCIVDNDPAMQFSLTPSKMVSLEKKLRKGVEKGEISDLEFGREITVKEIDGFWKEINN